MSSLPAQTGPSLWDEARTLQTKEHDRAVQVARRPRRQDSEAKAVAVRTALHGRPASAASSLPIGAAPALRLGASGEAAYDGRADAVPVAPSKPRAADDTAARAPQEPTPVPVPVVDLKNAPLDALTKTAWLDAVRADTITTGLNAWLCRSAANARDTAHPLLIDCWREDVLEVGFVGGLDEWLRANA